MFHRHARLVVLLTALVTIAGLLGDIQDVFNFNW
jgi:hypothetical protein